MCPSTYLNGAQQGVLIPRYSNFSSYFDKALKRTRSRATYHSFNTQTVQIHKDDIVKFIDYLRSGLVF